MVRRSVVDLIDDSKPNSAAAQHFHDRAGLAAFGLRKPCGARDILWALGYSQRIQRAARAGLFTDASDILRKSDQRAGLLGVEGGSYRADGLTRPHDRAGRDRILQHRRIDHAAGRAAGPFREPFAQPALRTQGDAVRLAGTASQSNTRSGDAAIVRST